jgi:hypothetical protein
MLINSHLLVFSQEPTLDFMSVIDHYEKSIQSIRSLQYSYNLEYEQDAVYRYHNQKTYLSYHYPQSKASNIQVEKEMLAKDSRFVVVTNNKESNENSDIQIMAQNFSKKNNDVPQIFSITHPCLLGFISGSPKKIDYIPKLLREYVTSAKNEIVDGQSMVHLHGLKDGLEVSAWIVPSQNYSLYRIQYKIDEKSSPGGEMISFDYKPKNFQQYGDIWLPSDYNYDYTMLTINYEYDKNMVLVPGKLTKGSQSPSVKLENIKVNANIPNRVFSIKTKIPNGTRVTVLDAQQIEYVWFDGVIEPKTDDLMLRIARGGHRFMPGVGEPRFWLIATGLFFIILGIALKIRAYLKQRRRG